MGFLLGVLVGKPVINWLRDRGIGKSIRVERPCQPPGENRHTYDGRADFLIPLVVLMAIFMDLLLYKSLLLPLGIVVSCGILGGVDDYMSTIGHNRGR